MRTRTAWLSRAGLAVGFAALASSMDGFIDGGRAPAGLAVAGGALAAFALLALLLTMTGAWPMAPGFAPVGRPSRKRGLAGLMVLVAWGAGLLAGLPTVLAGIAAVTLLMLVVDVPAARGETDRLMRGLAALLSGLVAGLSVAAGRWLAAGI